MLNSRELQNLLPSFIEHLIQTGSSRSTIKNYTSDLKKIVDSLPNDLEIGQDSLERVVASLNGQFSESTLRRFGYSLKAFTNWLKTQGHELPLTTEKLITAPVATQATTKQTSQNITKDNIKSPVTQYSDHIKAQGAASSTTRLYTAAVTSFFTWLRPGFKETQELSQQNIDKVSHNDIERYISFLRSKGASESTIQSNLYSLRSFFNLHKEDIVYETNPVKSVISKVAADKKLAGILSLAALAKLKNLRKPRIWYSYRGHPMSDYVNWAASAGALLIVGLLVFEGFFAPKPIDIENLKTDIQKGLVLAATPPRILSFQGRLTNASGTPVTVATNIVFRIWDQVSGGTEGTCAGGGGEDCFWKSKTWSVTPDANGIFSVQLGDTGQSDTAIPASLFSDNASLFLGVTIGADSEATPRQQIASSSYALNSDSLDGIDSLSFLRSDTSDNFTSGTLTTDAGTTLSVLGDLTIADTSVPLTGASFTFDFNNASDRTFTISNSAAGTANLSVDGGVSAGDTISVDINPNGVNGTTFSSTITTTGALGSQRGLAISFDGTGVSEQGVYINQTAAGAVTDGLKVENNGGTYGSGLNITNTSGTFTNAISITGTFTSLLNTPTLDITGAGAITGATGVTSSGTITFSSMITDANAVLYTTTGGIVTRVVETETGSQCLLSGAGASGVPVWGACPGGFSGEVDDTTNDSLTFTSDDASPPAGTVDSIFRDNTGDLNLNVISGKTIDLRVAGTEEYNFSATGLDFNSNNITELGTNVTSSAGLTIATSSDGVIDLTPNGAGNVVLSGTTDAAIALDIQRSSGSCVFGCYGILARPQFNTTESGIASAVSGQIRITTGAALTNAVALNAVVPDLAAGTITNSIGVYVQNQGGTGVTNAYGIYLIPQASASGNNIGICFDCDGTYNPTTVAGGIQWGTDNPAQFFRSGSNTLSLGTTTTLTAAGAITFSSGGNGSMSLSPAGTGDLVINTDSDTEVQLVGASSAIKLTATDNTANLIIQDTSSNTLFQFKDLSTNFGGLAIGGAFASINTYWGEEFNSFRASCTAETVQARGDAGNKTCSTTTGDISTADVVGGTGDCIWRSIADGTNGYEQINTADGNATTACLSYLGSASANDAQLIFRSDNLPVVVMKVRPSRAATGDDDSRYFVGIGNLGVDGTGTSTDAQTIMDASNDTGVYFSNCTAPQTASSCNDSTWNVSVQDAGSNPVTVDCGVTISTTQFAYMRIEVISAGGSAASVRAYVDGDVSNGISETACPDFSSPPTLNADEWGWFVDTFADGTLNGNFNFDIDYVRIWQDDAADPTPPLQTPGPNEETATITETDQINYLSLNTKVMWRDSADKTIAWINDLGETFFEEITATVGNFKRLVFGEAVVKKDAQTAGSATFDPGSTEVFIESDKINEESLINLTAETKTNGMSLYVKEKRPGEGFVVALERNSGDLPDQATASATAAIKFSWFILNQE